MTSPEIPHDSVNYDYFLDRYGLGPDEVDATVSFGDYTGSVAAMLDDPRCPVGNIVADAYATEGVSGVEAKLAGFQVLSSNFNLQISHNTRSYHVGATDRASLIQPLRDKERPDFLV